MNISKVMKTDYHTESCKFKQVAITLTDGLNKYSIGSHINNDDSPKHIKRLRLKIAFEQLRNMIGRSDFKEKAVVSE